MNVAGSTKFRPPETLPELVLDSSGCAAPKLSSKKEDYSSYVKSNGCK